MNWDAIGAIGEILGALTVVATIFYLSLQIRQNTKSQSIAIFESAMSGFNETIKFSFGDVGRAGIMIRGSADPDSLNAKEIVVWNAMARQHTNHLYKLFRLYELGVFPEQEWKNALNEGKQLFESPGMSRFKATNHYFADLWKVIEQHPHASTISDFGYCRREDA